VGNQDPHPQDPGARRLSRTSWPAVWAVFLAGLAAASYIGKVPPLLPVLREDLGLSLVQSGLIATMLNVMGGLVGMFAGLFSDRYGHKRFALTGLALLAVSGVAGASAQGFATLLLARFFEGAGFIMTTVAGVALMTGATLTADRPRAMSMWSAYMPTGGTLALLVAPMGLAALGWRGYWLAAAAAPAAAFVLVARCVPAPAFGGSVPMGRLAIESLLHRGALALCCVFLGYTAQWATIMIWLPTYAVERGATPAVAALLTVGMVGINIPGNLLGSWVMARGHSRAAMIVFASLVQAASCALVFLEALPDVLRYGACLVFSFVGGLIPMAVLSGVAVHARTREHIGTTNGMVMQISQIGQFAAPLIVAAIATRAGWQASLPVMLAFAACAIAGGVAIGRIELSRPAP